ncbi:MAG: tripartite tricarboxylate transporter substrate binding protein [Planctomycetota bacterium]|jgi:tripartite-type tricarboxylate transporter receptor subunit TctC|nr:tripartite tricarboxylate transporter substrate binding protein [Planctomycetota bacterium]
MKRIGCALALAAALVLAAGWAPSLDYPRSPVSIIVPYGAGGGTDLIGRALADTVKGSFPRGIAVENRLGGGGSVGMSYGQNARPDGNIITNITVELVTLPHTGTGGDISHEKFIPLIMFNSTYSAVTVQKSSPHNTLKDLLTAAKTDPIQVGNSGIGAIWHLAAASLEQAAGVEFIHVPFDGAAPAITSLLGGHIDAVTVSYAEVVSQVDAGELKVLAVLAPQRLPVAPDIPTATELGYNVSVGSWRGFGVPLNTPPEIVAWLEKTFTDGVNSPGFVKFMKDTKNDIELLSSAEYAKRLARDYEMFGKLINDLGLSK